MATNNNHSRITSNPIFLERVKVKANGQTRALLGSFTTDTPPRGFFVELRPDPTPSNSVQLEIMHVGAVENYKLVLRIANHSKKAVSVDIWQL